MDSVVDESKRRCSVVTMQQQQQHHHHYYLQQNYKSVRQQQQKQQYQEQITSQGSGPVNDSDITWKTSINAASGCKDISWNALSLCRVQWFNNNKVAVAGAGSSRLEMFHPPSSLQTTTTNPFLPSPIAWNPQKAGISSNALQQPGLVYV